MVIFQPAHRLETRNIEGINVAGIKNPDALTVGSNWIYDIAISQPTYEKYMPFDRVTIINNGEDDITFYPNMGTDKAKTIVKGTIWVFDSPSDIPSLMSWRINNLGTHSTTITAGLIEIQLSRKGMVVDSFTKALSRNVFTKMLLGL